MKIYNLVKNLRLISAFLGFIAADAAIAEPGIDIHARLDCGIYEMHGYLTQNKQGNFLIRIKHRSRSPYEYILLGGEPEEKLRNMNTAVAAQVSVNKKILSNDAPFVMLEKFLDKTAKMEGKIFLLNKKECE